MSLQGSQHRMKMATRNRKADYTGRAIYGRVYITPNYRPLSSREETIANLRKESILVDIGRVVQAAPHHLLLLFTVGKGAQKGL
jgi:hypothetical protein